uniref:Inosine triphosphate pyrophosphatase n=1 Tax=Rhabditophanes sp. KR3021 TaxID=114890 RepID=A0AC35UE22_9BILA
MFQDMSKTVISFVTGNANKLREVNRILSTNPHFEVKAVDFDLPEYQGSPAYIAEHKCMLAVQQADGPVIIEDTCLAFNAYGDLPGPYIKHFLKEMKCDGLVKMLSAFEDKSAYAMCTFAYCEGPGKEVILFQGKIDGQIVAPRGETTFGWDPIFQPESYTQTFAEMDGSIKDAISHRGRALASLSDYLNSITK